MPLYTDVHNLQGATTIEVDQAHAADLIEQGKYVVEYLKYWFNESRGKAFCLVEAPSPEAAQLVHREAHGQMAERIIEVQPELVEAFVCNALKLSHFTGVKVSHPGLVLSSVPF